MIDDWKQKEQMEDQAAQQVLQRFPYADPQMISWFVGQGMSPDKIMDYFTEEESNKQKQEAMEIWSKRYTGEHSQDEISRAAITLGMKGDTPEDKALVEAFRMATFAMRSSSRTSPPSSRLNLRFR